MENNRSAGQTRSRFPRSAARWLACLALVLATLACGLTEPTPTAWAPTPSLPPVTDTPPPTALPTPPPRTPRVTLPPLQPTQVPGDRPWLVAAGADGARLYAWSDLSAAQPDEILLSAALLSEQEVSAGASPTRAWLALRTQEAHLLLVSLRSGKVELDLPLIAQPEQASAETRAAVLEPHAVRWSPDGGQLAFVAALKEPSADLYLLDLDEGIAQPRQVTRGIYQPVHPTWSPNGRWVVLQDVLDFSDGQPGRAMNVWATAADHNEMRRLLEPGPDSRGEVWLGWTAPEIIALYTRTADGGQGAMEIPMHTRWTYPFYSGAFQAMAVDPSGRDLAVIRGDGVLFGSMGAGLTLARPGRWSAVRWDAPAGVFVVSGQEGVLLLRPDGSQTLLAGEGQALIAPDQLWVAAWGGSQPGLRLYEPDGKLLQSVSDQAVDAVVWAPDSRSLLFSAGGTGYRAAFPAALPVALPEPILGQALTFVPQSGYNQGTETTH